MNDIVLTPKQKKFRDQSINPWLFRTFLFFKIPLGWISGMKIKSLDPHQAITTINFNWLNQNPFKSMYFGSQSMAAELATGSIVLMAVKDSSPTVKAIIVGNDAEFVKKAKERVFFSCNEGTEVFAAIKECQQTNHPVKLKLRVEGKTKNGTLVSAFHFNWIFSV